MKYTIVVDYGKPYEIEVTEEQLPIEINRLREIADSGEYPFFDVMVLDEQGMDITDYQFIQEMIDNEMD